MQPIVIYLLNEFVPYSRLGKATKKFKLWDIITSFRWSSVADLVRGHPDFYTCWMSWSSLADLESPWMSETARPTSRFIRMIETRTVNRSRKKWAVRGNGWPSTFLTRRNNTHVNDDLNGRLFDQTYVISCDIVLYCIIGMPPTFSHLTPAKGSGCRLTSKRYKFG